jgi:outer membrane beta-barrel protein
MRALRPFAAAALLCAAPAFAQSEDEAGDVSEVDKDRVGPLRERVRPVSGHLFLKRGRFEASPSATLSLNDAFFTKYVLGGTVGFFPMEQVGIHLRAGYSIPRVSGAAQICTLESGGTTRGCRPPSYQELDGRAPGQITWLTGLDVSWSPLYGKVGLLAERFLHFDLYALGGVSAIGYRGPTATGATASAPLMALGGNVGIGSRIVISRWMTLRAELRDLIYAEQVQPLPRTTLRNQLMFELGFSMFLPTSFIPE